MNVSVYDSCLVSPLTEGKPSLQSRHSLDSTRVQDKESGPLWITLALQKQKGFREQQQSRDERRSHKLSEKQTKDKDSVCYCTLTYTNAIHTHTCAYVEKDMHVLSSHLY